MLYLIKKNKVYYLRIRIPKDMRPYFPFNEIKRSLHTLLYKQATSLVKSHVAEAEKVFMMIRSNILTLPQVYQIVDKYLDQLFLGNQDEIKKGLFNEFDPEKVNSFAINQADDLIIQNRKLLAECKYVEARKEDARTILEKQNFTFDETSPEFDEFCKELMKADIMQCEVIKSRAFGITHPYDIDLKNRNKSNTLQDVMDGYIQDRRKNSKARSLAKLPEKISKIRECFEYETGEKQVLLSSIDHSLTIKVAERLAKYPSYRNLRYSGKSLDEIYKLKDVEYSSYTTINEELKLLYSLYEEAQDNYRGLEKNYAKKLSKTILEKPRIKESEYRSVFKPEDINEIILRLLEVKREFHKNPHRYLIPLIGLYSGMRVNEICQLYLDDIVLIDGLWCFDNNENKDGKSLKNSNSNRTNPIHPDLKKIGLIEFCKSQKKKGYARLWEGVTNSTCEFYAKPCNHSHYFDKWFNGTFKKHLILSNPSKQTFHSFRHTFIDWYNQRSDMEGVLWNVVEALSGHLDEDENKALGIDSKSVSRTTYSKDIHVQKQFETLRLLDYGLDLDALRIEI